MSINHVIDQSDQKLIEQALGKRISRDKIISDINGDPDTKVIFDTFSPEDQEKIIAFLAGERTLQILCDSFFKKILDPGVTPERVESLLSAIYGEKVEIVEVLPKEGIVISDGGSQVIMDIIVRLSDGSYTTVEMQRLGYLFPGERTSCYLSDMMMRQYQKVRSNKGKNFSYKDLNNVNLIVIMEESSKEFLAVAPEYIHRRETSFDSGAKVKSLENVTYISLDTFKEKNQNEIGTELDAWLTFFTVEKPEDVLRLLSSHPEFLPMYKEITGFRKEPAEVIGMFSEELRIMDRNTTKYMIDELHEQVEAAKQELETAQQQAEAAQQELETAQQQVEAAQQELETAQQQVEAAKQEAEAAKQDAEAAKQEAEAATNENIELKKESVEKDQTINKQIQTIDLQVQTIEDQEKTIEILRKQLAEQQKK